jgi:hypothetical protein
MKGATSKSLPPTPLLPAWSPFARIALAASCVIVFGAVWFLAGGDARLAGPAASNTSTFASVAPARGSAAGVSPIRSPATSTRAQASTETTESAPDAAGASNSNEAAAAEIEQRRDAIRNLATIGGPGAVAGLANALRSDDDVRNRIYAIDALRRAALAGNADRSITDVLREASTSENVVVAAHARNALEEIERAHR